MGLFGGVFSSHASVQGIGDSSDFNMWKAQVCTTCRLLFCGNCIALGRPTPCPECGNPTVPAFKGTVDAMGVIRSLAGSKAASISSKPKSRYEVDVTPTNVILVNPGMNRLRVMAVLRKNEHLDLKKAKTLVDSAPVTIAMSVPRFHANYLEHELVAAGALVELDESQDPDANDQMKKPKPDGAMRNGQTDIGEKISQRRERARWWKFWK